METKEEFFQFEREKQKVFDQFYKEKNWICQRVTGKENKYYDCILKIGDKKIRVEEKYRNKEYPDLLVELEQDTETQSPGWLDYSWADWLLYGVKNRIYGIKMMALREFVEANKKHFPEKISEKGWGKTRNIAIPWAYLIQNKIAKIIR